MNDIEKIPYGHCYCGCGCKTKIAENTVRKRGHIKGEPLKFINHHNKITPLTKEQYLENNIIKEKEGCWNWQGPVYEGVPMTNYKGYRVTAHRLSYEIFIGEYSEILRINRKCANNLCVNPSHIYSQTKIPTKRNVPTNSCWFWEKGTLQQVNSFDALKLLEQAKAKDFKEAFIILKGQIPKNALLSRTCGYKKCINPEHMFLEVDSFDHKVLSKITKRDGCHIWGDETPQKNNYIVSLGGKKYSLQRLVYEYQKGKLTDQERLIVLCGKKACVNPDHLILASIKNRVLTKMRKTEHGCWVWTGSLDTNGYATISIKGKSTLAHRVSYTEFTKKEIPEGYVLDHLCRNIRCVNPKHLEPVTHSENVKRGNSTKARKDTSSSEEVSKALNIIEANILKYGNASNIEKWSKDLKNNEHKQKLFNHIIREVITSQFGECWVWKGCPNHNTYGQVWLGKEKFYAHRASYMLFNEEIPEGLVVDHICHVKACINPNHLQAINQHDNVHRSKTTKLTKELVFEILASADGIQKLSEDYNITRTHVEAIRKGKRWKSAYYEWQILVKEKGA